MQKGYWYALGAYVTWGLFPIYWKWLQHISALQLIGHRVVWSCVMLFAIIVLSRQWREFRSSILNRRVLAMYALAGVLIAVNWTIYVWAVNSNFIVETSLGYFINPLVSVLLGVVVLGERLRLGQWLAIALAAAGVLYLTLAYGSLPWISLALACTFGIYGLVKKMAPLGAVHGLALETGILLLPALAFLSYESQSGRGAFFHSGTTVDLLMIGAGPVTTIPLLLFAAAARRIPLSMVGLFQYIAPTIQFLIGVFLYHEPFTRSRFIGFSMVWLGLLLSALEAGTQGRGKFGGGGVSGSQRGNSGTGP
jgi:chloramphenicol-sensitive protein RarD